MVGVITRVVLTLQPDGTWRVEPFDNECDRVATDGHESLWEAGRVAGELSNVHTPARVASRGRATTRGR